ncbi:helix-turn-helix domain-containing protein [Lentilactobacillus sp. IMAU92037]|uniref:helix-turn-helix domain-containing protein n=1 Tax=Lentilactobacillus TaxID=2767893 RepID=UPI001C260E6E|nr:MULTISPECIES: helix-turn-helix transcriptional regulator [Lentilactobacillus]MBU9788190.1 helix-turn-helix domain-containing protein [Lentilactobacillus dabitei]MBV0929562.1 helix-turn-helix domain-containing protein [Lentilactobacillus dabitei]MDM7515101.1 helix-turn-helix transcriptional regulator [Lentilactobacillus sp. TOM.63]
MKLNDLLKQKRLASNLTQEQLAEKIYVSPKTISNWERGKTFPDIESLINLSQLYHLSLDNLLVKGSGIVNDYKDKEQLAELSRNKLFQFFGPTMSSTILFIFLFLNEFIPQVLPQQFQVGLGIQIILLAAMLFNVVSAVYIRLKGREIKAKISAN